MDTTISKVRKFAKKIKNSATQHENYKYILQHMNLGDRKVPLDVKTRWNSTFLMLLVALQDRQAIDIYTRQYGDDSIRLNDFEWEETQIFSDLLEEFFNETNNIFRKGKPTLSTVVPIMQGLQDHLENFRSW